MPLFSMSSKFETNMEIRQRAWRWSINATLIADEADAGECGHSGCPNTDAQDEADSWAL